MIAVYILAVYLLVWAIICGCLWLTDEPYPKEYCLITLLWPILLACFVVLLILPEDIEKDG